MKLVKNLLCAVLSLDLAVVVVGWWWWKLKNVPDDLQQRPYNVLNAQ